MKLPKVRKKYTELTGLSLRVPLPETIQQLYRRIDELHNHLTPDIAALQTRVGSLESFREMIMTFLTSLSLHEETLKLVRLEHERNKRLEQEYDDDKKS